MKLCFNNEDPVVVKLIEDQYRKSLLETLAKNKISKAVLGSSSVTTDSIEVRIRSEGFA